MMHFVKSLSYALQGFVHAFWTELNLKLFLLLYLASLLAGLVFTLTTNQWMALLISGGTFLATELMNTALERLTDAFDDHIHKQDDQRYFSIKATKDVAAAAALMTALTWLTVMGILFLPAFLTRFPQMFSW